MKILFLPFKKTVNNLPSNAKKEYNEIFFLDNILHQCAHVFFNTLTIEKKDLFKIPYDSPFSKFTGEADDHQLVLYDRFHGLFTQTNINTCLEKCIDNNVLKGDKLYELIGRFVSNMKRFKVPIEKFDKEQLYKPHGLKWFVYFKDTYNSIYDRKKYMIDAFEVTNQPYVFSYDVFKKSNYHKLLNLK